MKRIFLVAFLTLFALCIIGGRWTKQPSFATAWRRAVLGPGEDFTHRTTCIGAWVIEDTDATVAEDICDESRGADDLTGNGNPAVITTVPTGSPSWHRSMDLDGDDWFERADEGDFEGDDAFTFGLWANQDVDGAQFQIGSEIDWSINIKQAGVGWRAFVGGLWEQSGTDILDDTWYHLVVTWNTDDDFITVYTNGKQDCTAPCEDQPNTPTVTAATTLGWSQSSFKHIGFIHEAFYFSEELSAEEICQICSCGLQNDVTDRNVSECGSCSMGSESCAQF